MTTQRVQVWATVSTEWSGEVEVEEGYGTDALRDAVHRTLGLGVHDVEVDDWEDQDEAGEP